MSRYTYISRPISRTGWFVIIGLPATLVAILVTVFVLSAKYDHAPYNFGTVTSKEHDRGWISVDAMTKRDRVCQDDTCEYVYTKVYTYREQPTFWSIHTSAQVGDSYRSYTIYVPESVWAKVRRDHYYVETGLELETAPSEIERPATDDEIKRYFSGELRVVSQEDTWVSQVSSSQ